MKAFESVFQVVQKLRDPSGGCPWDLKQNHKSLLRYLIEESYEFIDAVEKENRANMVEELGDVLLQVLLHSVIASQESDSQKKFSIEDVCLALEDKLVRRHPHVFGPNSATMQGLKPEQVLYNWQKIKEEEKGEKAPPISEKQLFNPALTSAYEIGKKSAEIHFDWDNAHQVSYKVEEEWQELKEEVLKQGERNRERMEEEMGDFLFSAAQFSRHLGIDPENALKKANQKFVRRFLIMSAMIKEAGKDITQMTQKEMDVFWDKMKLQEKK